MYFLYASIHDITSNLFFIIYWLNVSFFILLLIDLFYSPNSLESDFTALCLTGTKEWDFKLFYLLTSGVSTTANTMFIWKRFMSVLISPFLELLFSYYLKITLLICSIEFITKKIYTHLLLAIFMYYFSQSSEIILLNNATPQ